MRQLPPESALHRALDPDWEWRRLSNQLLAGTIDALNIANWQRPQIFGGRSSRPPDPIPRPGITPDEDVTRYGGNGPRMTIEELQRRRAEIAAAS